MHDIVRWFADCGDRYVRANLAHIDVPRLETDRHYGLKLFFFTCPRSRRLRKYQLGGDDLAAASNIIQLCRDAEVSPLRVNQGIWYFAANAVADEKRLRELIRAGDPNKLDEELELMNGFLPTRPMWG
jgi:hypothetical protein